MALGKFDQRRHRIEIHRCREIHHDPTDANYISETNWETAPSVAAQLSRVEHLPAAAVCGDQRQVFEVR